MAALALYDHQTKVAAHATRPHLSETVRKVDCAVARLEELQCLVRASHTDVKVINSVRRRKLALHARDAPKVLPYRHTVNRAQHACHHQPVISGNLNQGPQRSQTRNSKPALPIAASRRARAVAIQSPSLHRKVPCSSRTADTLKVPGTKLSPPSEMPQSSPPSSACSSSVPVVTRGAPLRKEMPSSKLSRTFFVDAGLANPNRPWCLSSSPSPASTSSTTSNYIYTPSSNSSSAAFCLKSPSRFSPLYRQSSRSRKDHDIYQSQPLLCKSPEGLGTISLKEGSPNRPRKTPWFSQTRLPLPTGKVTASNTKRAPRRFSLASDTQRDSPPRPLPALITRLPMRRKSASSPNEKLAASVRRRSFSASAQKGQIVARPGHEATVTALQQNPTVPADLPPLPLPPALQGQVVNTIGLTSDCKGKVTHKRSSSCPRQCLLPVTEGSMNTSSLVTCSLELPTKKLSKEGWLHGSTKENCFPGCSPAAWPNCMRRSWSFSHQPSLGENLTGAGPYM
ncbi:hypothetical protein L7F22_056827 [Adiantum nelumboides]|nr:hypothetical protein [Adiantum nelumboides]